MAAARLRSAATRLWPAHVAGRGERRLLATAAAEVAEVGAAAPMAAGVARWEPMGAREYYDYRRAIYGDITHKAILVDAAGTLLAPTEPMAQWLLTTVVCLIEVGPFKISFEVVPCTRTNPRDCVVTKKSCMSMMEDLLAIHSQFLHWLLKFKAWHLCDPDAGHVFQALRRAGVKTAVVSNFDTRLRPLLQALKCDHWFDAVAVSAEVAAEKPNPIIFLKACELLGVKPEEVVHIGDDRRNDLWGARDAGCDAWLWGSDVYSFKEVAERIGVDV
ncbi:hypothetical protein PR202_ga28923 [Eleusine coracana subsp. coracana]|uniref:N-acylneuraminate-9-phosphatase n=1 Tax=Eleusine coracana subsp. coracana TaxID=191504 RepID=A0AAV5DIB5_ELECO|nr:hypothetical protein PR202_ga28923 [Eleusine coracana subsp. coracana]